jgi:hypothetical protein
MKILLTVIAFCLLLFGSLSTQSYGQASSPIFNLPDAISGKSYEAKIEGVLRDMYALRFEGASSGQPLQWSFAGGEFPLGMNVLSDGTINGAPQSENPHVYRFRLSVSEGSTQRDQLTLDFALELKAASLRLTNITGVRLVPISASDSRTDTDKTEAVSNGNLRSGNSQVFVKATPVAGVAAQANPLTWGVPSKASGATVSDINQAEYSVGVIVDSAIKPCVLGAVVMKRKNGADFELVDKQVKKVEAADELQNFDLKLAPADNHIVVTAYEKEDDSDVSCGADTDLNKLSVLDGAIDLIVNCHGNKCGKAKPKETDSSLSSKNTRAILGVEQSGASSAASAQNPFLDFFFNAGLGNKHWLSWGDVRLTTTPQQVTAFASSAANVAGAAKAESINELATSFDFTVGPEFQFNPNDKTRLSLIAGFGATSTLTGPPTIAPIFKIPTAASTQYANFISQYPEATTPGATHIAFLPQEQDRFFRHYFLGFRVKSYHGERFPSMFDVTFGQNSAVTGGMLRHFVLGFEGSHHFPLMKNSIYIFGSANLKVGGPKFRSTPFILDPADTTVKLTDPSVVLTSRQSNRDFYRIGFGVDLIDLFKGGDKKE